MSSSLFSLGQHFLALPSHHIILGRRCGEDLRSCIKCGNALPPPSGSWLTYKPIECCFWRWGG